MSLVNVTAKFECDECSRMMEVWLDESYTPPNGWSVFDIAEDRLRGGCGIGLAMTSVQNDRHLCAACTKTEDAKSCQVKGGQCDCTNHCAQLD